MSEPSTEEQESGSKPSIWATVREALRGSQQDFTKGPLSRAVVLLAIPMVLEMSLESVFAVVDVFFVSRLGAEAVTAVGLTESMLALVYAMGMGLATAVTAIVSRRWGEGDAEGAAHATAQALLVGVIAAIVVGALGFFFAEELLLLMGAEPEVVTIGVNYTRIMLGGQVTIILLFLLNAAFRGAGDPSISMRVLWIANGINICLDPALITGWGPFPEMGVTGAAVATTIGRSVGVILAFRALTKSGNRLTVRREHWRFDSAVVGRVIRLARTASLQFLVGTASWIGLVRLVATYGSTAVAGYTVAIRLVIFGILPRWGLSNAAATLVGQSLGANKPDRANSAVWVASKINLVFLATLGVLFVVFAPTLVSWFGNDPAVSAEAERALRIVSLGFPLYAFGMVITAAFNGAGDTWTPTWLNFIIFWLWEIPLAWILARTFDFGPAGAYWAITIAFSSLAAASALVWRRGRWRNLEV